MLIEGGAIYWNDPDRVGNTYNPTILSGSSITGCAFTKNSANQNGGAVYVTGTSCLFLLLSVGRYILPGTLGQPSQPASPVADFADNLFTENTVSNCAAQCGTAWYMSQEALWKFANNTFSNNAGIGTDPSTFLLYLGIRYLLMRGRNCGWSDDCWCPLAQAVQLVHAYRLLLPQQQRHKQ